MVKEKKKMQEKIVLTIVGILLISVSPTTSADIEAEEKTSCEEFKIRMNKERLPPIDPQLIEYVKRHHLLLPTPKKYNLKIGRNWNPSKGLVQSVNKFLTKMDKGVFVECGAHNGESTSNTLWLERNKGWTGLLIEPDPKTFEELKKRNRKAFLANVCLSSQAYPEALTLYRHNNTLGSSLIYNPEKGLSNEDKVDVQCVPLETLLLASGLQKIDLFSLDVEGYELEILKGIDFEKLSVKIFMIEYNHLPRNGEKQLHQLMTKKGYKLFRKLKVDLIYVHSSVMA